MSSTGSAAVPISSAPLSVDAQRSTDRERHPLTVRVTHWIAVACFLALLVSGLEIVVSHPRFYWGEAGNDLTQPLFKIPIPASRRHVPTGYSYTLPDQNGWSRALHFQSAWAIVLTGVTYFGFGFFSGHFRRELIPNGAQRSWRSLLQVFAHHLRFERPDASEAWSYNALQRLTYLFVLFIVFPLMIWTGLAMSPSCVSAYPFLETLLGGRQTARTVHFLLTLFLVGFVGVHILMVWRAGFWSRVRAMITGRAAAIARPSEHL